MWCSASSSIEPKDDSCTSCDTLLSRPPSLKSITSGCPCTAVSKRCMARLKLRRLTRGDGITTRATDRLVDSVAVVGGVDCEDGLRCENEPVIITGRTGQRFSENVPPTGFADFTVSFSLSLSFTFRQRNQCKRERCRILAQVINEVPCPPLISWRSGGLQVLRRMYYLESSLRDPTWDVLLMACTSPSRQGSASGIKGSGSHCGYPAPTHAHVQPRWRSPALCAARPPRPPFPSIHN